MDTKLKNYLAIAVIGFLALGVLIGFWYVSSFSKSIIPNRTFSVSAEGKVVAIPNVAELSFGVLTQGGKNLSDLQKENTEKVNQVIAFLKGEGVDGKDIKTQFYNITPRYQYFSCPPQRPGGEVSPCPPAEIVGYTINQSVSVKIRELNKVGDVVAGVVGKGANTVSGPTFTVDDPTELQNQARAEALLKAKEKAKSIAKAGGFRLGKLLSISESIGGSPPIPFVLERFASVGIGAGGPSIEPGSQEIRVNITISYEIR